MSIENLEAWFLRWQFSGSSRLRVYRKIARLQKNGVSLGDALRTMLTHESQDGKKPKSPASMAISSWIKQTENGKTFGVAVRGWVPENDRIIIEAGEKAGSLAGALDDAVFIFLGQKKIKSALIAGLAYPIVLVLTAIGLLLLMGNNIIPTFASILPREKWTGVGAQMAMIADFVDHGLIPSMAALIMLIGAVVWSLPRWTGATRVKFDRIPPWSLYRLMQGSGFLLSFATMNKAGIKTTDALRLMQRDAQPWMVERLGKALGIMNNGFNLGEALYRSKMEFPDAETVNDLRTYAGLDKFDEALVLIGRENLEETVQRIDSQASAMRNVGIVLLALVFTWIAAGIFSLQQQMTSNF